MSNPQIDKIIQEYNSGRVKEVSWKANSVSLQEDEIRSVLNSSEEVLRDSVYYAPVILRGDAGRIVYGSRPFRVEIPVFAFVQSASVIGNISKPNEHSLRSRLKAALWYERVVQEEFMDQRTLFGQSFSLGGLFGSIFARSWPMLALATTGFVVSSLATPIFKERNAIHRIAVDKEFHENIASYLSSVATYEAQRGHYWEWFKVSRAYTLFMKKECAQK